MSDEQKRAMLDALLKFGRENYFIMGINEQMKAKLLEIIKEHLEDKDDE